MKLLTLNSNVERRMSNDEFRSGLSYPIECDKRRVWFALCFAMQEISEERSFDIRRPTFDIPKNSS